MNRTKFPNAYQRVTDRIVALLEEGTLPWEPAHLAPANRPRNFSTGRAYSGVNVFLLGSLGAASPWWLTYRQADELGGHVREGEKGQIIVKYGTHQRRADPETVDLSERDDTGKKMKRSFLRAYTVFHASQIDGIAFPEPEPHPEYAPSQKRDLADRLVAGMPQPPAIREGAQALPAYYPRDDRIEMPDRRTFCSEEAFYKTLFHELTHATGHESRLARASLMESEGIRAAENSGRKSYGFEELVAEMGAAYLAAEVGILEKENDWDSAAYIQGWLQALRVRDHRHWVVRAASQAQRASEYILKVPERA